MSSQQHRCSIHVVSRGTRDTEFGTRRTAGISWLILAQILRDRLGPLAERVPAVEAPGAEPPALVIHNERAKRVLGWRPRAAATTITETAESLRDLGLLEATPG